MAQFRTRIEELEAQLARVRTLLLLAMREWHSPAAAAHACTAGSSCLVIYTTELLDILCTPRYISKQGLCCGD